MSPDDVVFEIAKQVRTLSCIKCQHHLDVSGCEMFSSVTCPHCQTPQKVPAQLENFLLFDVLGRGGMAVVYRALDTSLGRQVAVKVMRRQLGEDVTFVDNFLREARAAAQLNHPNIVQIYTVGKARAHPFIVMELLDGGRLDEMMQRQSPLAEDRVLKVARDVSEGLARGAELGIIHGDIKPANILFDKNGVAKVADFGLAKFHSKKAVKGEIWGTPYYIAPEKARGVREDQRSDIYSLGATLYHAFANQPPFDAETATAVVMARLNGPPPDLLKLRPDLRPATVKLITRMLDPDPMLRYPNYKSLLGDIHEAMGARSTGPISTFGPSSTGRISSPITSRAPAHSTNGSPPEAKGKIKVIGFIVAAIILIGAGVFLMTRKNPDIPLSPGTVPTPPPGAGHKTPTALVPMQPFSAEEMKLLHDAAARLTLNDTAGANAIWKKMADDMPKDHPGRPWLVVIATLPTWMEGRTGDTLKRLQPLCSKTYSPQADGSAHPALLAQAIAKSMTTGEDPVTPVARSSEPWPSWYEGLGSFFSGAHQIRAGKLDQGAQTLRKYLELPAASPAWVLDYQPLAKEWISQVQQWLKTRADYDSRINKGAVDAVIKELEARLASPGSELIRGTVRTYLEDARKSVGELQRKQREAARAAETAAQQKQEQEDLAILSEWETKISPLLAALDFEGPSGLLEREDGNLKSAAGKEKRRQMMEAARMFRDLRDHIIKYARGLPYRNLRDILRGDMVGATSSGILIQPPDGRYLSRQAWSALPPKVFTNIAHYYITNTKVPDTKRGELLFALAWYADNVPEIKPYAPGLLDEALKAEPALNKTASAVLPGMAATAP